MATFPNDHNTLLVLYGMGLPLYAARGLTQTLQPIAAATNLSRSINGAAMDLSYAQFRKYASSITCNDFQAPSIDGIWPGMFVTVECVCELSYPSSGGTPERYAVSGSTRTDDDAGITFYRPVLDMQIIGLNFSCDEYKDGYQWSLDLEEV